MFLQVSFDDGAKKLIDEKGSLLTISSISIENCCVPINEVSVQYNKPENTAMFYELKKDNISLYIDKKLQFKNDFINIKRSGFGPFQTIRVEGVSRF